MPQSREKLLQTAAALFYASGVTATGVDAVVRAAGVTKPTLYTQFGSKDGLVAAVLERRHSSRRTELEAELAAVEPDRRPLAVFDWLARWYATDGDRGCAFLNAAAELPDPGSAGRAVVRAEKSWLLGLLVQAAADAGRADAELVGSQLLLLVDGVAGRAVVGGAEAGRAAVADARAAAAVLLASAGTAGR